MDTNVNLVKTPADNQIVKRKVKKCYNRACMAMIFQMILGFAISFMASFVYSTVLSAQIMMNEGITDPALLTQKTMEAMHPASMIIMNAIAYLIANPIAYLIGNAMTKKHYNAKIFNRIQLKPADCGLAILAVLGVQMLSLLIQSLIMLITNTTGINESTAQMMSFSDDPVQNIVMVVYTVLIAAVTEELLCRGLVMKALSPINQTFALVASSMIFGIMHGNFNQMFNGFLLGMVIGYAGMKSKSVWLPIILHMCANAHAMIIGFLEYKIGESFMEFQTIYIIALLVIGLVAAFFLFKRNGKIDEAEDGFPCVNPVEGLDQLESKKGLTWKALLTTPCFWIFTAIYVIIAISMISPIVQV